MIETRVEVHKSDIKTIYIPQYKSKFFWLSVWVDFGRDSFGWALSAYLSGVKSGHAECSKEFAELVCEKYHKYSEQLRSNVDRESIHKKTKKISYYKHP